MTTATDVDTDVLIILAASWDETVPCKTADCERPAEYVLGIQHLAGYACEVTVSYPACGMCRSALWLRCQELAKTGKPCVGCLTVTTAATDYIRYDRNL